VARGGRIREVTIFFGSAANPRITPLFPSSSWFPPVAYVYRASWLDVIAIAATGSHAERSNPGTTGFSDSSWAQSRMKVAGAIAALQRRMDSLNAQFQARARLPWQS
jgi:hypothetical protein